MKSNQTFKLACLMMFIIGFQKLVAQPQFIIQDKVVFVAGAANVQGQEAQAAGIIQDEVVFVTASTTVVTLDTIHKKLGALKKGTAEKAHKFQWYNAHPTSSLNIEGYNIVIMSISPLPTKPLAEVRFVRQKTNVWIDTKSKFKLSVIPSEIKNVTYTPGNQNRRADIETNSGYKFSLVIDATTGRINLINALPNTVEVRIYKTPKLI